MESHDEERVAYRIKQFGNSSNTYTTRDLAQRIERLKATAVFTYALPGPKMMWQWGEWGYDIPIDENGRTGIKPLPWNGVDGLDYNNSPKHRELYNFYKALLNLRRDHDVFSFGDAEMSTLNNNNLLKQITFRNDPYSSSPTSSGQMNVVIAGNFDVTEKEMAVSFPHIGKWYSYFTGSGDVNVTNATTTINLKAGEFRLYTDVELEEPENIITSVTKDLHAFNYYPNPVKDGLSVDSPKPSRMRIYDQKGNRLLTTALTAGNNIISLDALPRGLYLVEIIHDNSRNTFKIIKQ
jgi:hypothetical protein